MGTTELRCPENVWCRWPRMADRNICATLTITISGNISYWGVQYRDGHTLPYNCRWFEFSGVIIVQVTGSDCNICALGGPAEKSWKGRVSGSKPRLSPGVGTNWASGIIWWTSTLDMRRSLIIGGLAALLDVGWQSDYPAGVIYLVGFAATIVCWRVCYPAHVVVTAGHYSLVFPSDASVFRSLCRMLLKVYSVKEEISFFFLLTQTFQAISLLSVV